MAATNRFFDNSPLLITDGTLARATHVNSVTDETNSAFELVEAEMNLLAANIGNASDWATADQGVEVDSTNYPNQYSSRANAEEAQGWAVGVGGVATEADGSTLITRSAKEYAEDTAADLVLTNADVVLTGIDLGLTNADVVLTGVDLGLTNDDVTTTGGNVVQADASRALAAEWAEKAEDSAITGFPGHYSSLHWAAKAEASIDTLPDYSTGSSQEPIVRNAAGTGWELGDRFSKSNLLINGGFQIWQRSENYLGGLVGYQSADRWYTNAGMEITKLAIVERNSTMKLEPTSTISEMYLMQGIELTSLDLFKNRTLTLSFDVASVISDKDAEISIKYVDAVGSSTNAVDIVSFQKIGDIDFNVGFVRYSHTFTVTPSQPATSKAIEVRIGVQDVGGGTINVLEDIYFSNIKLEESEEATPFVLPEYGEELAKCQRYYWQGYANGKGQGYKFATSGSGLVGADGSYPVTMRTQPSYGLLNTPTYENCSHLNIIVSPRGFVHNVTWTQFATYRCTNGLYYASAEL